MDTNYMHSTFSTIYTWQFSKLSYLFIRITLKLKYQYIQHYCSRTAQDCTANKYFTPPVMLFHSIPLTSKEALLNKWWIKILIVKKMVKVNYYMNHYETALYNVQSLNIKIQPSSISMRKTNKRTQSQFENIPVIKVLLFT